MKRILVRAPNSIEDQILSFPFFGSLRQNHPNAWISVVCSERTKHFQFRRLVDDVVVLPSLRSRGLFSSMRAIYQAAKQLRELGPWDYGVLVPNSFGSALLFRLAKVKKIRGYAVDGRSVLLHEKLKWQVGHRSNQTQFSSGYMRGKTHRAQVYLDLVPPLGRAQTPENWAKRFDPVEQWPDFSPIEPPEDRYFVVAPWDRYETKRWPIERFAEFAMQLQEATGWRPLLIAEEKSVSARFKALMRTPFVDYVAAAPVPAFWKVFERAQLTVCNDSFFAHVASLCRSKVQVIGGGFDPVATRPIGPGQVIFYTNPVICWPCASKNCSQVGTHRLSCLTETSVQNALDQCRGELFHGEFA